MKNPTITSNMINIVRRRNIPYLLIASVLGTLNHFLYDFTGQNPVAALIAPINESIWEHMKLIYFPMLLVTAIQFLIQKPNKRSLWGGRLIGTWAAILSVIFLYYGYSGVLGTHFAVVDILLFFVGILIAFVVSAATGKAVRNVDGLFLFWGWAVSALFFFIFTCFPPELPLFFPPE